MVESSGVPLAVVISGANVHDVMLLAETLDAVVVARPEPTLEEPRNLCADAGYFGAPADKQIRQRGYIPHVRSRGEENVEKAEGHKPRRWVVEVTFSWLNRFRRLLVRWEKKKQNHLALVHFACAIIVWRKCIPVHQ